MHYVDTSVLAAYYCPEPGSLKVEKALRKLPVPVISHLVETELYSAVSRKVRMKELSRQDANLIISQFNLHVEKRFYHMLPIGARHYRIAREWLGRVDTALRTLDALHLAVAYAENIPILSTDSNLCKAATFFGIKVNKI